ncbi:MAG TPA: hypothetical protein VI248_09400 [Kineosporiaceae bacterium]
MALPPPSPQGVEWNGPGEVMAALPPVPAGQVPPGGAGWFGDETRPPPAETGHAVPASVPPAPGAPVAPGAPPGAGIPPGWLADPAAVERMLPFSPSQPVSAGPIRLEIAYPPDPVADDTDERGHLLLQRSAGSQPMAGSLSAPSAAPPPAPFRGRRTAEGADPQRSPERGAAPPPGSGDGWNGGAVAPTPPAPPAPGRSAALLVALAVLVLAAVGATTLYLRHSHRGNDVVAARPASAGGMGSPASISPGTSAAPGAGARGRGSPTGRVAGDVAPSTEVAADTPTPSPSQATFVTALNGLLDSSAAARSNVSMTVAALQACRTPAAKAGASLRGAGAARTALAAQAGALDPAGVPHGADAVKAFVAMQEASAAADASFALWADEVARQGCETTAARTMNWALGNQHSGEATWAKTRFVAFWNPIATASGLRTRTTDGI